MGYYISLMDQSFTIKKEKQEAALDKFKTELLSRVNELGRGGSWGGPERKKTLSWFSWTRTDVLQNATNIGEVLQEFGWSPVYNQNGDIIELDYSSEKLGQEELLFETIAEFVEPESYLDIDGEDGSFWRWCFNGTAMIEKAGKLVFE